MLINQKNTIRENSKKFRLRKCLHHKLSHFQKVCIHSACIQSIALSCLCNQCHRKHPKHHNGLILTYLDFDKIFSENVFNDIELLENECLNVLLEKQQKVDVEIDRLSDVILEEIKQLLESIKFRTKQKYSSNSLIDTVLKLKESLQSEYNTVFSVEEANIKDEDIKHYLEFYLIYEKMFEENQAKIEGICDGIQNELSSISQLFNQKLKDIRSILASDDIREE